MQVIAVNDKKTAAAFLAVNVWVNKNNSNYVQPLDKDVNEVFDEKVNKSFRFGSAKRWLLQDAGGAFIGRIAAFTNKKYKNKGDSLPVGGIGFFDCIEDQAAANLLFDTAKKWLSEQGVEAMDGPINFGDRDRWWGLVVEGFQEPMYCMNYNPPYYQSLFETYGFQLFFNQVCLGMHPKKPLTPKLHERHAVFAKDSAYSARYIDKNKLEKYATDFATVYNAAWAGHGGLKQIKKEQVLLMFQKMKPVMDEKIIWFAYHLENPIAIFTNLPDLNQWFKYLHGKFDLLHKLKFLWLKKTKPCKKFAGLVFGIVPEYQGMGMDAYIIVEAAKIIQSPAVPYVEYEMQWIGDFNPKMLNVAQGIGEVAQSRRLVTYRYQFDRNRPYERHPMLS